MTPHSPQLLDENLFTLFQRQAQRRPDATAVIDESGACSYGTLEAHASAIADALILRGLRAEQPVGVFLNRNVDLIATLLGVLKAGGCYVPLDPDDPPERARRIVLGAGCQLVLGHTPLLEKLRAAMSTAAGTSEDLALVDIHGLVAAPAGPRPPEPTMQGGNRLAYILFTSGSTGMPKGVEVEHRHVVNLLVSAVDFLGVTQSDRYLATSTVGFDSSVAEMYLPLITGGTVILHDRSLALDPRRLASEVRKHGVTVLMTGPTVWSVALATVPDFPRVRIAISHGEAIPHELAGRLVDLGDVVWNLYGPTETTVWATGHKLARNGTADSARSAAAPIGRPLAHVQVRVLDEQRVPVPPGVEGELWIGGPSVARGYRGNDELTRERFVTLDGNGTAFYRTGDVVAMDADGIIHYLGRNDDQLKVRGVRIEPMEVEAAVRGIPGVSQTAATWFPTKMGSRSIVAAVVFKPGVHLTSQELHVRLSRILPPSMVPARFVFCPELPLLPSGKIDRAAIRERSAKMPDEIPPEAIPDAVTETERILIGIWERVLGVRPVHRTDHFFTVGGDSLSAVTVILEVEAAFAISLTVRAMFERPTLDGFAERVDRARVQSEGSGNTEFIYPLVEQGRGNPVFFSHVELPLARNGVWKAGCPLYSMTLWAHGKGFASARTIEELARDHIERIRSIQPHGPYRLAGYSFGGLVALEVAQQLQRAGETMELLFLLDPSEPFQSQSKVEPELYEKKRTRGRERLAARIMRHARYLARHPRETVPYVTTRAIGIGRQLIHEAPQGIREWMCYALVHLHGRNANPLTTRLLPKNRWPAFWYVSKRLGQSYVPRPYDGAVLAVFLNDTAGYANWQSLLGPNADVLFVDSDHTGETGLFSAEALAQWLDVLRVRLDVHAKA